MVVLGKTEVVYYSVRYPAEKSREAQRDGEEQRKQGEEKESKRVKANGRIKEVWITIADV